VTVHFTISRLASRNFAALVHVAIELFVALSETSRKSLYVEWNERNCEDQCAVWACELAT
jgi:hypothetical protein